MGRGVRAEPLTRPVGQGSSKAAPGFDWMNPRSRPKNSKKKKKKKKAGQIHLISTNNMEEVVFGRKISDDSLIVIEPPTQAGAFRNIFSENSMKKTFFSSSRIHVGFLIAT